MTILRGAGLRDDKCWVHHDEDCRLCRRYWMRTPEDMDVEYLCGPQSHPDHPSVCLTCGESLVEKDGTWVHAIGPKRGLKGKLACSHGRPADTCPACDADANGSL